MTVQLMNTDPDVRPRERIVKKAKRMVIRCDGRRLHLVGSRAAKKLNHGATQRSGAYPWETKQGGMAIGQAALFLLILTR